MWSDQTNKGGGGNQSQKNRMTGNLETTIKRDSYAPTLHPCISETPNANLSFSPDSDFLVVTASKGNRSSDYQHTRSTPNRAR